MAHYQFSHRDVHAEILRMTNEDKYSPAYIGQVRSGYVRSEDLEKLIAQAVENLSNQTKSKAA